MSLSSRRFRSTDWTSDNLPERIAEVRQLYLDTLEGLARRRAAQRRPIPEDRRHEEGPGQEGSAKKLRPRRRRRRRLRPRRRRRRRRPPRRCRRRRPAKKAAGTTRSARPRGDGSEPEARELRRFTPPTTRWCWRRCRRRPNSICSTTGWRQQRARASRHQGRGAAAARRTIRHRGVVAQLVERARGRRGPLRRAGAGVLGARRTADPGQGRRPAVGPRHLPPTERAAAPHPSQGSGRGPGWSPASRPRSPNFVSSGRTPPSATARATSPGSCCAGRAWRSNGSNCGCSGRNTSRRD